MFISTTAGHSSNFRLQTIVRALSPLQRVPTIYPFHIAVCQEVKRVLTPSSQESQDKVASVWSVCLIPKDSTSRTTCKLFK